MFQQKDTRLAGERPIWLSPDRDLAVMFPHYMVRALDVVNEVISKPDPARVETGVTPELLKEFAKRMGQFTEGCTGDGSPREVKALFEVHGLLDPAFDACWALVGKWVLRVLMGAYFKGVRDSLMKGEKPLYVKDLLERVAT